MNSAFRGADLQSAASSIAAMAVGFLGSSRAKGTFQWNKFRAPAGFLLTHFSSQQATSMAVDK
jgi:hypothetical protein